MSACLFVVDPSSLTHKKTEEIEGLMEFWQNSSVNTDLSNKFECDRAAGFKINLEIAQYELLCRKNGTTAHSVQFRLMHELREGAPNIKKALLDASAKGVGYIRLSDKNPDLWFEYITEEELKKSLK